MSPSLVFEQIRTTDKRLNTHPASESLFSVWADQNHWQEWLNTHLACESLQYLSRSEPLTRMAGHASRKWVPLQCSMQINENDWTCIQRVSPLQCLSRFEPLTRMASRKWVPLQCWVPLTRMAEHASSLWAPLCFLSRSESLMRKAEHPSSLWVSAVLEQIGQLTRKAEHPSSLWVPLQFLSTLELPWLTKMAKHHPVC